MIDALKAEYWKVTSVRSPLACVASVVVVTLAVAAAVGANGGATGEPPDVGQVLTGLLGYGLIIMMAMSALSITSEYGTGTIRVTFSVLRSRPKVLLAKCLVMGIICALTAAVLTPVALFVGGAVAGQAVSLGDAGRYLWGVPVVAALSAALAVGIGALIRRTAGAVAIVVIWPLLVEGLTTLVPKVGDRLATFMPFSNAYLFLGDSQGLPFAWPPLAGLLWFTAIAAAATGAAVWVTTARDA
jgi:ABC-2 type transport system permease protein